MRHTFEKAVVVCHTCHKIDVLQDADAAQVRAAAVVAAKCRRVGKQPSLLQGLDDGMREVFIEAVGRIIAAHLGLLGSYSCVYTPARAHLRWGDDKRCHLCRGDIRTWPFYVEMHALAHTRRRKLRSDTWHCDLEAMCAVD